jgi:hypothetical protein
MHHTSLKEIISWIATYGIKAYSPETIARDLNISLDESLQSAHSAISAVLRNAFNAAQFTTGFTSPTSADEFFDVMLTFLENLSDYKTDIQRIFNQDALSFESFRLTPVLTELTHTLFASKIETFLDKLTYTIIVCNILYEWLTDSTPDLAHTSTKINNVSKNIFADH